MSKITNLIAVIAAVIALGSISAMPGNAKAEDARIDMQIGKVGFIIGVSGGRGTVYFDGHAYPIRVGGVSLGATFAMSSIDLTGTVYNLNRIEDLYGNYTATSAGLAVVAGGKTGSLTNARGIRMELRGRTIGLEFSLDLSGINIRPR
ncbi:MAG: hypothetical protein GY742_21755 [Hyphomicrobiales bacterium]|nr:hypothetical protein [Hyphomicrobiales bacterium]